MYELVFAVQIWSVFICMLHVKNRGWKLFRFKISLDYISFGSGLFLAFQNHHHVVERSLKVTGLKQKKIYSATNSLRAAIKPQEFGKKSSLIVSTDSVSISYWPPFSLHSRTPPLNISAIPNPLEEDQERGPLQSLSTTNGHFLAAHDHRVSRLKNGYCFPGQTYSRWEPEKIDPRNYW